MKKKMTIITFAILWMSAFSLQAGVRIGAKAGVNLSTASVSTDAIKTENLTGFQVGPIIEISGLTGFGVDAAILYSEQGFRIKSDKSADAEVEAKSSTIDIPVNLKLKLSLADMVGGYLTAGPYLSFNVNEETTYNDIKTDWGDKKFGVGLNFGAGVEVLKHLQLGINYQLALNNDYSNFNFRDDIKDLGAKTRIWSITAAFFF